MKETIEKFATRNNYTEKQKESIQKIIETTKGLTYKEAYRILIDSIQVIEEITIV